MRISAVLWFSLFVLLLFPGIHYGAREVMNHHTWQFLDAPVITTHPESAVRCEGTSVQMRVVATGQNLQYQWQKNGTNIPGATQNLLTLINLKMTHAGDYVCRVSNTEGTVYSNPATLEIQSPLFITAQPQSVTLQNGQTAQFGVGTNGAVDVYQWFKGNTAIYDGGHVSGSQTQTLTITNASQNDQGKYFCKITGPCNQLFSDDAYLSIISSTSESQPEQHFWFPNPAKSMIYFNEPNAKILGVTVYSTDGLVVYHQNDPDLPSMNISGLNPGFYTIITKSDHKNTVQKLIITR